MPKASQVTGDRARFFMRPGFPESFELSCLFPITFPNLSFSLSKMRKPDLEPDVQGVRLFVLV